MTLAPEARVNRTARALRSAVAVLPRPFTQLRRDPPPEPVMTFILCLIAIAFAAGSSRLSRTYFPPSLLSLPLLFGGLLIRPRGMRRLGLVSAAALVYEGVETGGQPRVGAIVVVVVTGMVAYEFARSRAETGLGGLRADTMLVELRRRLEQQGTIPRLPSPWRAEAVVRPAGGGPFSGDFVVSAVDGVHFEVALVDVSGKGVEAGTRSLLLSGALGGLLHTKGFLSAANAYLIRQDWDEGFATACHLVLDTETGDFSITSAGHPPAAQLDAGSGRWSLLEAAGPALGLLPSVDYEAVTGALRPGDALLFYTDGLVEIPGRDLSVGIDKLLGEAERLVTRGFAGGGEVLVNRVAAGSSDDRSLVLLWRSRT